MTLLLAAFDSADTWTTVAQIAGAATLTFIGALWFGGVVWVSNDIRRRTTDPVMRWVSIGAAALLFVPGIILYLAIRPAESLEERTERRWEMDMLAQQAYTTPHCPSCSRRLREDFVRCPYCATALGDTCSSCSRFNTSGWVVCPYCGESKSPALVQTGRETAGIAGAKVRSVTAAGQQRPAAAASSGASSNGTHPVA
jgi:hypothetical protein